MTTAQAQRSLKWALRLMSWCYRQGVSLRHFLYDKKVFEEKKAPLAVVSIGNVMAGGAGKTQTALLLAEQLSSEMKIAILTRGYKGKAEHAKKPLHVDLTKHSPQICGDEPWMLASRLSSTLVIVNKNRFKSALQAQQLGAELLILDDGMQHRELHRDFEIVVIDGKTPFGSFLPEGNQREILSRLKVADVIFFVGTPSKEVLEQVSCRTAAPQVVAKIASIGIFSLDGKEVSPLNGKKVGVFCGIGDPHRFVKTVEELGAEVVAAHFTKDHTLSGEQALRKFASLARVKGASHLVCTEKDKVKLALANWPLPIVWIKAALEIVENHESWQESVAEIRKLVKTPSEGVGK